MELMDFLCNAFLMLVFVVLSWHVMNVTGRGVGASGDNHENVTTLCWV